MNLTVGIERQAPGLQCNPATCQTLRAEGKCTMTPPRLFDACGHDPRRDCRRLARFVAGWCELADPLPKCQSFNVCQAETRELGDSGMLNDSRATIDITRPIPTVAHVESTERACS